jgi:hypothetical protein
MTKIDRLNELAGWSDLRPDEQKELQRFVIRADTNLIDGMDRGEMQAALKAMSLSAPAQAFLDRAMSNRAGLLPAISQLTGVGGGARAGSVKKTPINLAFDGCGSSAVWADTMAFARDMKAKYSKDVPFTYFITTANFDPTVKDKELDAPRTESEARTRWALVQQAINEGHEIGDHTVRHADGSKWNEEQWTNELRKFHQIVQEHVFEPVKDESGKPVFPRWKECKLAPNEEPPASAVKMNGKWVEPEFPVVYRNKVLFDEKGRPNLDHPALVPYRPVGFRAPCLGVDDAMYKVLERMGYTYDTSQYERAVEKSARGYAQAKLKEHAFDMWLFPLIKKDGALTIPMDYNYFASKSPDSGSRMLADYKSAMVDAARTGKPWNIGHHFTLPNGRSYWEAMKGAIEFGLKGCPDQSGKPQGEIVFRRFDDTAKDLGSPQGSRP